MKRAPLVLCVVALLLAAAPARAKHRNDDHKHGKYGKHVSDRDEGRRYLEAHDVQVIREYYAPRLRSLPPGLAKKYARTGRLPPGWQKKIEPLPVVVERQLIVLPPEYRRGVIDRRVVVYDPRSGAIVDFVALSR